jgi:hypothetical protein
VFLLILSEGWTDTEKRNRLAYPRGENTRTSKRFLIDEDPTKHDQHTKK